MYNANTGRINNIGGYDNFVVGNIAPRENANMDYHTNRYVLDPVLGIRGIVNVDINGSPTNVEATSPVALQYRAQDMVKRELGLDRQIVKNNRILQGLSNPRTYLNSMNQNLANIGDQSAVEYVTTFQKFINYGYTAEDAKRYGLDAAKNKRDQLLKDHAILFPETLTNETLARLNRGNAFGELRNAI